MEKQSYIIVGDNNFWYAVTEQITKEELRQEMDEILENSQKYDTDAEPTQLIAYPIVYPISTIIR